MASSRNPSKTSLVDVNLDALRQSYDLSQTDYSFIGSPQHFFYHGTAPKPTFIIGGAGAEIKTNKGIVIDFSSMVLNCVLGQNDPWVKAHQIAYLLSERPSFTSISLGGHELYYSYPQRLAKLKIGGINDPIFNFRQCNGSDAVELAILAARAYDDKQETKRPLLISFKGSYHGQSLMAYVVSDSQNDNVFLVSKPENVIFLDTPPHAIDIDREELTEDEKYVLKQFETFSHQAFAVLIEPIQMNNAAHTFSKAFLKALNNICREKNICFILDEIQTGMGWLGTLTVAERHHLNPDIIALSKGLTGGNGPLALIIAEKKYNYLPDCTAGKTNGADIRSLVAANAVLDRLIGLPENEISDCATGQLREELRTGLLTRPASISAILDLQLTNLKKQFPDNIGEIRGCGVIRVLQILGEDKCPNSGLANKIHLAGTNNGIFVRNKGSELVIKPPLTITNDELALGFQNLIKTMDSCLPKAQSTLAYTSTL